MKTLSIFFAIILILGIFGLGVIHEQVHKQIFISYGINSHISYFADFPDFTTTPDKPCPNDTCILANNINDVIGYHLIIVYCVASLGWFIFLNKKN